MNEEKIQQETEQEKLRKYLRGKAYWGGRTSNSYIHYETVNGESFSFPLHTNKPSSKV